MGLLAGGAVARPTGLRLGRSCGGRGVVTRVSVRVASIGYLLVFGRVHRKEAEKRPFSRIERTATLLTRHDKIGSQGPDMTSEFGAKM